MFSIAILRIDLLFVSQRNEVVDVLCSNIDKLFQVEYCHVDTDRKIIFIYSEQRGSFIFATFFRKQKLNREKQHQVLPLLRDNSGSLLFLFSATLSFASFPAWWKNSFFFVRWRFLFSFFSFASLHPFSSLFLLYSGMTYIRAKVWVGLTERFRVGLEQARCSERDFSPQMDVNCGNEKAIAREAPAKVSNQRSSSLATSSLP